VIDTRREAKHIAREMQRRHTEMGETIIWFKFDVDNSQYDRVYNEGGRAWLRGLTVPVLWIDQGEAPEQMMPEGRRPVVTLRFAVGAWAIMESGVGQQEAHGHRVWDRGLIDNHWMDDRNNDIVYYDGSYWEVTDFQIRGRIREDTVVGVSCSETWPEDEYTFDFPPNTRPVAPPVPPIPPDQQGYGYGPYGSGPYGG
jgi:hypothetical protein